MSEPLISKLSRLNDIELSRLSLILDEYLGMRSGHEGYATLQEEVTAQVGAMALRFLVNLT